MMKSLRSHLQIGPTRPDVPRNRRVTSEAQRVPHPWLDCLHVIQVQKLEATMHIVYPPSHNIELYFMLSTLHGDLRISGRLRNVEIQHAGCPTAERIG
jgi:hypothetical protein